MLLVRHQPDADAGEIVVAQIDHEATVKVYRPANGYAVLHLSSSNSEHKPIIVTDRFGIYGVVEKDQRARQCGRRLQPHDRPDHAGPDSLAGRGYRIRKLGYHHRERQDRVWVHIFSVSTEAMAFRLRHHPEDLAWILEEVSDGTPS